MYHACRTGKSRNSLIRYSITFISLLYFSLFTREAYPQEWKSYPYHPDGGVFEFPADEGRHPETTTEWWYLTGHLEGLETGTHYSFMLTYFYFPYAGYDGFRILNLANEDTGEFYDDMQIVNYTGLSTDSLMIDAWMVLENRSESWRHRTDSTGHVIPFEYEMSAMSAAGSVDLKVVSLKPPVYLGDSGYFRQGASSFTYYYSQTQNAITGSLSIQGTEEEVSGTGWIDRQFGQFNTLSAERYEWFSVQLSNSMELNVWNLFTGDNQLPDSPAFKHITIIDEEANQMTTDDFDLERLAYFFTPDSVMCYSERWRLRVPMHQIDLVIESKHRNNEVQFPFRFYEGSTTISGMVDGTTVTGQGFAELVKGYQQPQIKMNAPAGGHWNPADPISWQLLNPDDGNPLRYDLEYTADTLTGFSMIGQGITDTFDIWENPPVADDEEYWLRVRGFSADTTIAAYSDILKVIVQSSGTSTKDQPGGDALNHSLQVFPNPADDQLFIALPRPGEEYHFQIIDAGGKVVMEQSLLHSGEIGTLDIHLLEPGFYILKVIHGQEGTALPFQISE